MFKWAISQDLVDVNPAIGLAPYQATSLKIEFLSADEVSRLWKWLRIRRFAAGSRKRTEIAGPNRRSLWRNRWHGAGGNRYGALELDASSRTIQKREASSYTVGWVGERNCEGSSGRAEKSRALFGTGIGSALTSSHVGTCLLARRTKLPIAAFTTHDLRRTVVTMLVDMGVSLDIVAAVVGHEAGGREARTLIRHYVRTDLIQRKREVLLGWDEHITKVIDHVS